MPGSSAHPSMGNGMCSRRHKRILQALALLAGAIAFVYGALMNYELQKQLKKAEALSLKYQQHQESLSAQLQVVYEHRSRLEKSLQKERLELKKAREDHLVYKLEAQETLNKGRQDSNTRYNALSVQHQMLKSQHEELRRQHDDLQSEHQKLGEDLTKTFSDHKEKYVQLQQEKEQEVSKLKGIYNLKEENKQLRKDHQDVHTQLQDVKQQHKSLQSQYEQVVMSLDHHKSALTAAQKQVEDFLQLKNALNKVSGLQQQPGKSLTSTVPRIGPSDPALHGHITGQLVINANKLPLINIQTQHEAGHEDTVTPSQAANEEGERQDTKRPELHKADEDTGPPQDAAPATEHPVEVEEEHKKELEEEEMEQVGKPERLVEEQDQLQEEQDQHRQSEDDQRAVGHEEDGEEETNLLHQHDHAEKDQTPKPQPKYKSLYEEQLKQQKLAAQKEEQARRLHEHQESLQQHRLQEHRLRQQQKHTNELEMERQNKYKEAQIAEKLRAQAQYDNMDNDIVQGEEEQRLQEEAGAYERDNHQDEAEEEGDAAKNANEEQATEQQAVSREQAEAIADDVNPANDPNNQGEDEFEEAEQEREENLPDENEEQRQQQDQAEKQEHLVMAGNPDQQEDNVDEQYQEEGEEEVQEDLTEEKKREQNAEEPYGENEEHAGGKQIGVEREHEAPQRDQGDNHDENYEEEEEEEEDGAAGAKKRRAEM
ncbi:Golgi integral membrane protein 4 isoform X1 [Ranitomeya variabilis]|uniref:Golgi integral membrane protein 4 isoform X1 n=1 Tax=Ranitomeya variabilis TaxID=490064 RepID=UPI004056CFAF